MKQFLLQTIVVLLALLLFTGNEVLAQGDVPKFELGGQFSLIYRTKPTAQGDEFVVAQGDELLRVM